jgi:hypothetical protein
MGEEKRGLLLAVGLVLLGVAALPSGSARAVPTGDPQHFAQWSRPGAAHVATHRLLGLSRALPLAFEENRGQSDPRVRFLARGKAYTVFITPSETVLVFRDATRDTSVTPGREAHGSRRRHGLMSEKSVARPANQDLTVLKMRLVGTNTAPRLEGLDELPGKANYFIGADPKQWRANLRTYAKVKAHAVSPGVDLLYYGSQGQLEYDVLIAPGASPDRITLALEGAQSVQVDAQGDLLLDTANGTLRLQKPRAYQEMLGGRVERVATYVLRRAATATRRDRVIHVGFRVAGHDPTRPLVIDPVLNYSSYLGGSGDDRGLGIAVDGNGNVYLTGITSSADFPTVTPIQAASGGFADAFVTKLNATGSAILYSTYLGGSLGDLGFGITVDEQGSAYVTGHTSSLDFPTVNPLQTARGNGDAFVAKLNSSGSALLYSTYLGGGGGESGFGIAVDTAGNAYVTGITNSLDFPTMNAVQSTLGGGLDAFVTKLDVTGSALVFSTYLGGSGDENNFVVDLISMAGGIAVDSVGSAYVTGLTESSDFPVANALQATLNGCCDAFVTKFTPAGSSLVYSTYFGSSLFDMGRGIAVDATGNAYVTGQTSGPDFPLTNPRQATYGGGVGDAFVTKLNPDGSALVYSTFLGGSGFDRGLAITVDTNGNAYVAGETTSADFPTADPLQSTFGGGLEDAFVAKLTASGATFGYSTYLGGSGLDRAFGVAVDRTGNAYVTGDTESTNFPATGLQRASGGAFDAFVSKIGASTPVVPPPPNTGGSDSGCFIATAAYGSALDPHVQALRDFRDRYLTGNPLGRALVGLYYTYSPPAAALIARHPGLKMATRAVLTPVVFAISHPGVAGLLALLAVVVTCSFFPLRPRRK